MGMFSFICPCCNKGIRAEGRIRNRVALHLIKDGEIVESLRGSYDGYGRTEESEWSLDWGDVCDIMFEENEKSGIMAFHEECEPDVLPEIKYESEHDPSQGFMEEDEESRHKRSLNPDTLEWGERV